MVEYLGERHIADAIINATENVVNESEYVTYDLGATRRYLKWQTQYLQEPQNC